MPKVVASFECILCGDIFEATSDGHAECKCGKNSVRPSEYSTAYWSNNGRGKNFKRIKSETFYFPEEYLILDETCMKLWEKIKNFKFNNCSHSFWANEYKDKSADGNEYIATLRSDVSKFNKYDEQDELKLKIGLRREKYSRSPEVSIIKEKLKRYYKTLIKLKYSKLDLNNRDFMMDYSSSFYRNQQDKYDYEFWL